MQVAKLLGVFQWMMYNNTHVHYHRDLNDSYVENVLGIKYMDTGVDVLVANNNRMLMGEVGCFLSHYTVWKKVN